VSASVDTTIRRGHPWCPAVAPRNRRLRCVQDPSAVTARNGRGVIGAVVVPHDHFARTREILGGARISGMTRVSGFVVVFAGFGSSSTLDTPASASASTPADYPSSMRTVVFPGGMQVYRIPVVLDPGAELLTLWVICTRTARRRRTGSAATQTPRRTTAAECTLYEPTLKIPIPAKCVITEFFSRPSHAQSYPWKSA
jgi:hypothetical protein